MPSRCLHLWGERVFKKNDRENYEAFMQSAKTVHTTGLLPHEVCKTALEGTNDASDVIWRSMVMRLKEIQSKPGSKTFIPICDMSGSMTGLPMDVAAALSLLIAESSPTDSPFHGKIIPFSNNPKLLVVPDIPDHDNGVITVGSLKKRLEWIHLIEWGMATNFAKV